MASLKVITIPQRQQHHSTERLQWKKEMFEKLSESKSKNTQLLNKLSDAQKNDGLLQRKT